MHAWKSMNLKGNMKRNSQLNIAIFHCNMRDDFMPSAIFTFWHSNIFMPPLRSSRRHYVFGLSVRTSVRTYVRLYVRTSRSCDRVIWRTDWWNPAKLCSCMYLAEPMNWLDFGVTRSKVKGHKAHYVCKNCSWSRYLKNRLMDSCQTLVMYVSCRADELIRFWGHEVKGQRSQGSLCMQKQLVIALSQEPIDGLLPNLGHVCYLQSRWTD